MDEFDAAFVERAARHFLAPGIMMRAAGVLGAPLDALIHKALPEGASLAITRATHEALRAALGVSLRTIRTQTKGLSMAEASRQARRGKWGHAALTSTTGAIGGFFGLTALAIELPLTTCVMLRSVAGVAQDFGEDLSSLEARLECLNVFALAGTRERTDEGYYAARLGMQEYMRTASTWAAKKTFREIAQAIKGGDAPIVMRFLLKIAERFELTVSEKVLLTTIPVVSTASAALINGVFSEHVGETAVYHFGLRHLERRYGIELVEAAFRDAKARLGVQRSVT